MQGEKEGDRMEHSLRDRNLGRESSCGNCENDTGFTPGLITSHTLTLISSCRYVLTGSYPMGVKMSHLKSKKEVVCNLVHITSHVTLVTGPRELLCSTE
jgi:hypothetical protein